MLNKFHPFFSIERYKELKMKIQNDLPERIEIGKIKKFSNKVKILNFSYDLFAILILIKSYIKRIFVPLALVGAYSKIRLFHCKAYRVNKNQL